MTLRDVILLAVWAVLVFISGWEILALITREKYFPTWSRMGWITQSRWPRAKYFFLVAIVLTGIVATTWLSIHIFYGECAFDIC